MIDGAELCLTVDQQYLWLDLRAKHRITAHRLDLKWT